MLLIYSNSSDCGGCPNVKKFIYLLCMKSMQDKSQKGLLYDDKFRQLIDIFSDSILKTNISFSSLHVFSIDNFWK